MFHSERLSSPINSIHDRALQTVYRDCIKSFEELLKKSVTIHEMNLQILQTEVFQIKNGLNQ